MRLKLSNLFKAIRFYICCILLFNSIFSQCLRHSQVENKTNLNESKHNHPNIVRLTSFSCYIQPIGVGKYYNSIKRHGSVVNATDDKNEQRSQEDNPENDVEVLNGKRLKNYYRILNLDKYASEEDIKNQYENLMESLKPLDNVDSNVLNMVNEAYRVLSNEKTRRVYDEFVAKRALEKERRYDDSDVDQFYHNGEYAPENLYSILDSDYDFTSDSDEMVLELSTDDEYDSEYDDTDEDSDEAVNLLPKMFRSSEANLHTTLTIPFEKAILGGNETITVSRFESCKCLENLTTCKSCNGYGLHGKDKLGKGFVSSKECSECGGLGKSRDKKCEVCDNTGRVKVDNAVVDVQIPRNVYDGAQLLIRNQGNSQGVAGKLGDLIVTLRIKEHEHMYRMGKNIYSDVTIPYTAAILGTKINLDSCGGVVPLEIPPGTQHGDEIQVPNDHIPMKHICRIEVALPKSIDGREKELLEKIHQLR